tara:strand:- start:603 stop:911 length:309 start_codon:yes stop_codon:yes gene_type:complete
MADKVLKKIKETINKLDKGFEHGEGFENHPSPHAIEGKLFIKTDSGVAFVFELEYNKGGKVEGEMCVLHEDEDGDMVPLSLEKAQEHITKDEQLEIEKMLLN